MAVVVAAAVEINAEAAVRTEEFSHKKKKNKPDAEDLVGFFSVSNKASQLDIDTSYVLGSSHQGQPTLSK